MMKILILKQEPKRAKYKQLIKYAMNYCDAISFVIRYDYWMNDIARFDRICENLNLTETELIKYNKEKSRIYSDEFNEKDIEKIIKNHPKCIKQYKEVRNKMEKMKKELMGNLIYERHNPNWGINSSYFNPLNITDIESINPEKEYNYKKINIYDICFYKTGDNIKEFLLKQKSLYTFLPPKLPEDLCFWKKGTCWMATSTHDKECFIYEENAKRIQQLKEIGLKFEEREVSKNDVPIEKHML